MSKDIFPLTITEQNNFRVIPEWIFKIVDRLCKENFAVFLVGGAVRDLLWDQTPADWDLATDALPEQVETLFSSTIPTGKRFGTITVIEDGNEIEITTLRADMAYRDGRHPADLLFTKDILLDLARRDFTMNAIAYDFKQKVLIDPFGGRQDLKRKVLRTVGEPKKRFMEDGLRMFRYYRFIATLDLKSDQKTEKAIDPSFAQGVSYERIQQEFNKLLIGSSVRKALIGLKQSGLLRVFLPELNDSDTLEQGDYHRWKLWEHILTATDVIKPILHLRLAALLHDVAKPRTQFSDHTGIHFYGHDQQGAAIARQILERMHYSNKIINLVVNLIRWHMFYIDFHTSDGGIRRLIAKVGRENIPDLLELRRADIVATGKVDYQTWLNWQYLSKRIVDILNHEPTFGNHLAINGNDLIEGCQLPPGPIIGEILAHLQELVLDEPAANQKEQLIELAREYLKLKFI